MSSKNLTIKFYDVSPELCEVIKNFFRQIGGVIETDETDDKSKRKIEAIDIEYAIAQYLIDLGVPAHVQGYIILKKIITHVIKNPTAIYNLTSQLYPTIAEDCATTPSKIDRAIRHAINIAWTRGNPEYLKKVFRYTDKPTNAEFIATLADKVKLSLKLKFK